MEKVNSVHANDRGRHAEVAGGVYLFSISTTLPLILAQQLVSVAYTHIEQLSIAKCVLPDDIFVDVLRWLSRSELFYPIQYVNRYFRDTVLYTPPINTFPLHIIEEFYSQDDYINEERQRHFINTNVAIKNQPGMFVRYRTAEIVMNSFGDANAGDNLLDFLSNVPHIFNGCVVDENDETYYENLEQNQVLNNDVAAILKWLHTLPHSSSKIIGQTESSKMDDCENILENRPKKKMYIEDIDDGYFTPLFLAKLKENFLSWDTPSPAQFTLWITSLTEPKPFVIHNQKTKERLSCVSGHVKAVFYPDYDSDISLTEEDEIYRFTDHDSDVDEKLAQKERSAKYKKRMSGKSTGHVFRPFIYKVTRKYSRSE
ncbi:hypothetical protein Ddc_20865 [Ditylenchus destructor]|nr:hypothetical protein Ddc_20865 [Ditylenchus destructor]